MLPVYFVTDVPGCSRAAPNRLHHGAHRYLRADAQMGKVGRHVLFNLRNTIVTKRQQLPVDFFNQNKAAT